ncbi:MAG: DUF4365 domain-containing protein [Candidatus Helarchaeota archaeon]
MYPKRNAQHIADTKARGLFLNAIPPEWICREMLERDYGIDFYLELIGKSGNLSGHLVAVQLKGTKLLKWKGSGITRYSLFSGIRTSTIRYWMSLQVPVFLCVAEFSSKKVFFAPIKRQIRSKYGLYLRSRTFSFRLIQLLELSNTLGRNIFSQEYYRERSYERFNEAATDIVIHSDFYGNYFKRLRNIRDRVPVSIPDQITLGCLYSYLLIISKYSGASLRVKSLQHYFDIDKKMYNLSNEVLHGSTIKKIISLLEHDYNNILTIAKRIITKSEASYWKRENPVLYKLYERL